MAGHMVCNISANQVFFWDLTLRDDDFDEEVLIEVFKDTCKQWVFQKEQGADSAYIHWQCRLNLKEKVRRPSCFPDGWRGRLSPTQVSTVKGRKAFSYVMKEASRIDGPWTDKDIIYVPSDVPMPDGLREWQVRCYDALQVQSSRKIMFMTDVAGGAGKTTFMRYLVARKKAVYIPPICTEAQQMAGYYYGATLGKEQWKPIVVFDIPRSTSMQMWHKIAPCIEMIKDGYAADGRNAAKFHLTEMPIVLVGYNGLPRDKKGDRYELATFFSHDKIDEWIDFGDARIF